MTSTAFLDLDGCLIDSRPGIGSCVDEVLRERGLAPLRPGEVDSLIGPPIIEAFRVLLDTRGEDPSAAADFTRAFRARYADVAVQRTRLVPGIEPALHALRLHARLIIVTSKPRHLARPLVAGLGIGALFEDVFGPGADNLEEQKTVTLSRARVVAGNGPLDAMIGDRRHDIAAAVACGIRGIGVTWGIGSRSELQAAGAERLLDEPSQLPSVFT